MNVMFARAVSFGNLHFLFWKEFFYAKTQRKVRFTIEVCPCFVLLTGMSMNDLFARVVSFGNLFFLFWIEIFFMPKLSVLARAFDWNTNERDVCRALSFGDLFSLFWMEFFLCQNSVFWLVLLCGIPMNVMFAEP